MGALSRKGSGESAVGNIVGGMSGKGYGESAEGRRWGNYKGNSMGEKRGKENETEREEGKKVGAKEEVAKRKEGDKRNLID